MIRVLVADDAPFIREIVRHIVETNGMQLTGEAEDGVQAVEMASAQNPDVILMDIIMPKKSGIEAAREVSKLNPNIKIIAFSTADQETMVMHALEAGCCSFLVKPFSQEDLLRAISDIKVS